MFLLVYLFLNSPFVTWEDFCLLLTYFPLALSRYIFDLQGVQRTWKALQIVLECFISGGSGILTGGWGSGGCRLSASVCKVGFLLAEHGFSRWFVPTGIVIGICCSSSGFFCQVLLRATMTTWFSWLSFRQLWDLNMLGVLFDLLIRYIACREVTWFLAANWHRIFS